MKSCFRVLLVLFFLASAAFCDQTFPKPDWKELPDPVASPYAEQGGEVCVYIGPSPKSLNYYLENSSIAAHVFSGLYESLLSMSSRNLEYEPHLASKWSISDDKKTFTFWIDKRAKWSDGKPVTAQDVKWTFDAIMNPANKTGVHKVSLSRFESPEVLDDHTIRFTAKEVHWKNLLSIGTFDILPKHAYENLDFNKINFELPVVSGPYEIGELTENVSLTLKRRRDWWNNDAVNVQGVNNFDTIRLRFYGESENAFEAFKKGLIDIIGVNTARTWVKETEGQQFADNWIIKQKIQNYRPVGFQGFAMNMRRPPFDDVNVRKAMAHLINREKMNAAIMYNQYFLHKSYFEDLYSPEKPCPNQPYDFNKDKARKLLADSGWKVNPKTGFLEKNGKPLTVKFLTRDSTAERFLAIYEQDLKDVGIQMVIDKKDWAAWMKDMDDFNYEITWAAWGAALFKDPEGMWASSEADRPSGNNITGFKNAKVDELIEMQKSIFSVEERHEICRKIDQLVYEQCPYVLLWNIDYTRLLYWNKFGTPDTVLTKYGDDSSAESYWWLDPYSVADLKDAMEQKLPLPPKPLSVVFDEVFVDPVMDKPKN
ncbi:extracellular solute-binding protein [Desulfatibacillum aliphaticivorans]|uniref:extracellular solute-binding protein n=1 Tax=Desulfatibacillum aliphaticivorans TaxID=218208 RepID=UPI000407A264|nr:extracellular solute-binding protein [Desulfatibacillum aliphaticivorans]